jgi:hypothetical protein
LIFVLFRIAKREKNRKLYIVYADISHFMIFGLPDITVFTVAGTFVLIVLVLFLWGLRFRGNV